MPCFISSATMALPSNPSACCLLRVPPARLIRVVTVVGWVLIFGFALRAALLGSIGANVRAFQLAYLAGFAGYLALMWVISRTAPARSWPEMQGDQIASDTHAAPVARRGAWPWWLVGCFGVRVLLLAMEPSDDVYRYVWEGRVQLAGFSPFVTPPDDPALAHLRDADWSKINHPDYPAIYPPVAQFEFLALAGVSQVLDRWACPPVYLMKLLHTVWDVLVVVLLGRCLRRLGRDPRWAIVYGLCPLVLTAFAIEGHLDSLMLLFTAAVGWAVVTKRMRLAGVALGLAIATKLVFAVLLPWFVVRHGRAAWAAVVVVVLSYLPYAAGGSAVFSSLQRFSTSGEFLSLLGMLGVTSFDTGLARGVAGSLLVVILLVLAWRRHEWYDYARGATGALLLLMPIVHFWYFVWVLMTLPFGIRARWVVAAAAMVRYFEAPRSLAVTGTWHMPAWVPAAVWAPFLLTWVIEIVVATKAGVRAGHVASPTSQ